MKSEDKKLFIVLVIFIVCIAAISIVTSLSIKRNEKPQYYVNNSMDSSTSSVNTFPFDINKVTKDQLTRIDGIGEKTAQSIISHREKIGKFTSLNQLLNVEGIGEKTLENLKQYLILENPQPSTQNPNDEKTTTPAETPFPIDINKVTKDQLILIDDIGEKTAESIISYREKIGGFTSLNQLLNISDIGDKTFETLKKYLTLKVPEQTTKPVLVNINTASYDELMQVEGMTEEIANQIIEFREKAGPFSQVNEVAMFASNSVASKIIKQLTI